MPRPLARTPGADVPAICYLPPETQAAGPSSAFSSQTPGASSGDPVGPSLALAPRYGKLSPG